MGGFAWVTLATNDSYSMGALVLAHSLRRVNTAHQLVVLITPGVTEAMKTQLSAVFNVVKLVDVLDSGDAANLTLLARPELGITFTKLHCWRLTDYEKCVFLDADTLVLQNSDELFEREEFSAAPDAGWPDCFNSGVFVYQPSNETFKALIEFALIHGSFDGGDQGLLNLFFSDWATKDIKKHLPFVYNMCSTATYSYLPAFKQFGQGLKIIHFIGAAKPWLQPFNTETGLARVSGDSQHITQFVQLWWDLFCAHVHPSLSTEMAGLAGALATVTLGAPLSVEQSALEEHLRRQGWEQGNIDYMGKDSFANIWQKICDTLATVPLSEEAPAPVAPVAAPLYVSSVELSPTGPVDTSPPANYTPVSALQTTVVDSEIEVTTKVAPTESASAVPQSKSPSVTEVASIEASKSSSAVAGIATQPSNSAADVNRKPPATTTQLEPTVPSGDVGVPAETTSKPVTLTPTAQAGTLVVASPVIAPVESLSFVSTAPDQALSEVTASTTSDPPKEAEIPKPVESPQESTLPTLSESSVQKSDKHLESQAPILSQPQEPIPSEAVLTEVKESTQIKLPQSPALEPTLSKLQELTLAVVEEPTSSKPQDHTTPTDKPVPAPEVSVIEAAVKAPLPLVPIATEPLVIAPLVSESKATSPPTDSSGQIPTETATVPQPGTPTVTEPTPPTSPPVAFTKPPLTAKLQVDTDVPATPPVTSSSSQPSLAAASAEEPPIPPKRKGGSKASQEGKNQKGGKQPKGKK